jgi:hypothetical protein
MIDKDSQTGNPYKKKIKEYMLLPGKPFDHATTGTRQMLFRRQHQKQVDGKKDQQDKGNDKTHYPLSLRDQ